MPSYVDFPAYEPRCRRCNATFGGPNAFPPEPDDLVECLGCWHTSEAADWFHYDMPSDSKSR